MDDNTSQLAIPLILYKSRAKKEAYNTYMALE